MDYPNYSANTPAGNYSFNLPSFQSMFGQSMPDLLQMLSRLRIEGQQPQLSEAGRQFDVSNTLANTQERNKYDYMNALFRNQVDQQNFEKAPIQGSYLWNKQLFDTANMARGLGGGGGFSPKKGIAPEFDPLRAGWGGMSGGVVKPTGYFG